MDFSILDHCDLASVACWWWRRRIPVKRPLESLVPRLKIGGSLYTFTQKIVISLLWLTFDLEQSFSSEISRMYLPFNRPKTILKCNLTQNQVWINFKKLNDYVCYQFMYETLIGNCESSNNLHHTSNKKKKGLKNTTFQIM